MFSETVTPVAVGVATVVVGGRMFAEEQVLAVAVVLVVAVEIPLDADTVLPVFASAEVVDAACLAAVWNVALAKFVVVGCTVLVAKGPGYVLAFVVEIVFVVPVEPLAVLFVDLVAIVVEVFFRLTTPVVPAERNVLAAVIREYIALVIVVVVALPGQILDLVALVAERDLRRLMAPVVPAAGKVLAAAFREVLALVLVVVVVLVGEILDVAAFVAEGDLLRLTALAVAAARNEFAAVIEGFLAFVLIVVVAPGEIVVVDVGRTAPVLGIVAVVDDRAVAWCGFALLPNLLDENEGMSRLVSQEKWLRLAKCTLISAHQHHPG